MTVKGCALLACTMVLLLGTGTASGQGASTSAGNQSIVQPGAPGQASKALTEESVITPPHAASADDISFMQGMIMHHSQAVEMTDLLRTRGRSKELLALGKRISISQTDEINFMKQWLEDRNQPTTMQMDMKGTDHKGHSMDSMLMPGMLTAAQMKALEKAKGAAFDHLFLTGMIQHHTGALVMVQDLFDTRGAGQDPVLFDFATDIDNTQRAEIEIMRRMLEKEKK